MKPFRLEKLVPPEFPLVALSLVGLLLFSAYLYYSAVKIQRFLEPALALSQPRNDFAESISSMLRKEFGPDESRGIRFYMGSVYIDDSVIFSEDNRLRAEAPDVLRKLARVFTSALEDSQTSPHIALILVANRFPVSPDMEANRRNRMLQYKSELVMYSIFQNNPDLEKRFGQIFAATAIPSPSNAGVIEFRIVPTEQLHIEVLQRLKKYVH